jgi:hypothetical protein
MIFCEWDAPEGHPGQCCIHLYASVFYRRLSPQFQFSLSAVYSRVSISVQNINCTSNDGPVRIKYKCLVPISHLGIPRN